jgi:copper chaperone CopZ
MTALDTQSGDEEVTEIDVIGASCPSCFQDAIDAVRRLDGVTNVHASVTGGCITVSHRGIEVADVLDSLRTTLHGVDSSGYGIEMLAIDPMPAVLHCKHGNNHPRERLSAR